MLINPPGRSIQGRSSGQAVSSPSQAVPISGKDTNDNALDVELERKGQQLLDKLDVHVKAPKTGVAKSVKHYDKEYFPAPGVASDLYSHYRFVEGINYGLSEKQWRSVSAAPRSDETRDLQTKFAKFKTPMDENDHQIYSENKDEFHKHMVFWGFFSKNGLMVHHIGTGLGKDKPAPSTFIPKLM